MTSDPLDQLDDLLRRDAARVRVEPSPGFPQRVVAAAQARRSPLLRLLAPLPLAAAALLAVGVGVALLRQPPAAADLPGLAARPAAVPAALPAFDLGDAIAAGPAPMLAEAQALRSDLGRAAGALAGMLPTLPARL